MTTLGALLLNPPLGVGSQTIRHLRVAADVLGCDRLEIANLFSIATHDQRVINDVGRSTAGWEAARPRIQDVIVTSDLLLAGWGVGGLAGQAAQHQRAQIKHLSAWARDAGHEQLWTLNGEARHPSRWHQYVSDRHGRASGESLHERVAAVLTQVPVMAICPSSGHEVSDDLAVRASSGSGQPFGRNVTVSVWQKRLD